MFMGKSDLEREADIRRQSAEFFRDNHYDGHNRHSGITTMQDLGSRRCRRLWNCRMKETVISWNNRNKHELVI